MQSAAIVSPRARLGARCTIGAFTIVHDDVVLGDDVTVESHCVLGHPTPRADTPLQVGSGSLVRSHSVLYRGSTFGPRLITGHRVTLREGIRAGENLQVGTLSDLQGDTVIGDHVRMHSNVFVGQKATIGSFVWIFPYTVLTNDPHPPSETLLGVTLEDYAVVATLSCILPGVTVGTHAFVGAQSLVTRDVPAHSLAAGAPAKNRGPAGQIVRRDGSGAPAYPWPHHFRRGYPAHVVAAWARAGEGEASERPLTAASAMR